MLSRMICKPPVFCLLWANCSSSISTDADLHALTRVLHSQNFPQILCGLGWSRFVMSSGASICVWTCLGSSLTPYPPCQPGLMTKEVFQLTGISLELILSRAQELLSFESKTILDKHTRDACVMVWILANWYLGNVNINYSCVINLNIGLVKFLQLLDFSLLNTQEH